MIKLNQCTNINCVAGFVPGCLQFQSCMEVDLEIHYQNCMEVDLELSGASNSSHCISHCQADSDHVWLDVCQQGGGGIAWVGVLHGAVSDGHVQLFVTCLSAGLIPVTTGGTIVVSSMACQLLVWAAINSIRIELVRLVEPNLAVCCRVVDSSVTCLEREVHCWLVIVSHTSQSVLSSA